MRLRRLVTRGFRNLAELDAELPADGVVLLGGNGQGKTNLLEAIGYPVLFRSLRGAPDQEVARFGAAGFQVAVEVASGGRTHRKTDIPHCSKTCAPAHPTLRRFHDICRHYRLGRGHAAFRAEQRRPLHLPRHQ